MSLEALDSAVKERFVQKRRGKPEGSFFLNEYTERYGLSHETARRQVQRLLADGVIACEPVIHNGRAATAYSIVEKKTAKK